MVGHFGVLDGGVVGIYIIATMAAGIAVRKYVGKVEHFLIAGREMNLYLGIASLAATEFGIVTCMYTAQNGLEMGFAGATPGILTALAMGFVGYTGFCVKPLRDAGVMTIPELFDRRFGARIRWLSGVVIVLGGLLNMGVFLRTGGDFLTTVAGLSPEPVFSVMGHPVHYLELMMTALLLAVGTYTILGGMLSVLVTDFLQFVVMSLGLLAVTILILVQIGWTPLAEAVTRHYGAGGFNPFAHPSMGWSYVVFNALLALAVVLTWQTTIQRLLAAKDTQTGMKVYTRTSFFFVCRFLIPGIWGVAALATLAPESYADNTLLAMPMFLAKFVPLGLMGILVAAMLAADMSTDSSYMITWGSVIYNDIMGPFRRGQWSDQRGLLWNRFIVAAIGIFLLFYGLWYPLQGDLWTYLALTGTIYLSSMSTLLIACCYWRGANSWGAAGAIILGALFPLGFLVLQQHPNWTPSFETTARLETVNTARTDNLFKLAGVNGKFCTMGRDVQVLGFYTDRAFTPYAGATTIDKDGRFAVDAPGGDKVSGAIEFETGELAWQSATGATGQLVLGAQIVKPFSEWVGPHVSGILAYVAAWLGMIGGSYLKRIFKPGQEAAA